MVRLLKICRHIQALKKPGLNDQRKTILEKRLRKVRLQDNYS